MNYRATLLVIVLILTFNTLKSQNTVLFAYDANGNRTERTLIINQLKSAGISFPADSSKLEQLKPDDLDKAIQIYPNPFRSTMRLLISGHNDSEMRIATIYNLSGTVFARYENLGNESEFDLNSLDDGIYILRLIIDSEVFDYKIIKSK